MIEFIDTHAHIDGEEFATDREAVLQRAREAGCGTILVPAIDLASSERIVRLCEDQPDDAPCRLYPMVGLHPEEVRADYRDVLRRLRPLVDVPGVVAIGEVGLDYYWSREYEQEQLDAFEQQAKWSVETRLPLMIHCRKAQNEMVSLLRRYANDLPGGVFHCFTGNAHEAAELLQFPRFVLGIGGVLTFKKSHLPEVLPATVPLDRIVVETDSPYMAPVPCRGQRNEPALAAHVLAKLAVSYGVSEDEVARQTNANAARVFGRNF